MYFSKGLYKTQSSIKSSLRVFKIVILKYFFHLHIFKDIANNVNVSILIIVVLAVLYQS